MRISNTHLLLDACCIINFAASGFLFDILSCIPAQTMITEEVKNELSNLPCSEDESTGSLAQFKLAIKEQILGITDFKSESEEALFIDYASTLGDDGEASTAAIAIHRGWSMATDDKKAISFFQKQVPDLQIISTLDIVRYWSQQAGLDSCELREKLESIQKNGRYTPHKNHPLLSWWLNSIKA
jgi:predicted nucleic acid-binding protein